MSEILSPHFLKAQVLEHIYRGNPVFEKSHSMIEPQVSALGLGASIKTAVTIIFFFFWRVETSHSFRAFPESE